MPLEAPEAQPTVDDPGRTSHASQVVTSEEHEELIGGARGPVLTARKNWAPSVGEAFLMKRAIVIGAVVA